MLQPTRSYNAGNQYRYGFNGQEKSDEIKGEGNSNTAEFWEYDTRLGKRWNVDPRPNISLSAYACFEGNPIWLSDRLGDTARAKWAGNNISYVGGKWIHTKSRKDFDVNSISKKDVKRAVKAYTVLNEKEEFSEITTMVNTKKNTVYLKWGEGFTDGARYVDQVASGILNPDITVYASKSESPSEQNYNLKKVKLPDYIVLGHELGHVWDMFMGKDRKHFEGTMFNEGHPDEAYTPALSEVNAMYWENVLRSHAGITLRISYGENIRNKIRTLSANVSEKGDGTAIISTVNGERDSTVPAR